VGEENDPSDEVLMAINDYGRTISCGDSGTLVIEPIVLEFGSSKDTTT
jgi:hypothetical protein